MGKYGRKEYAEYVRSIERSAEKFEKETGHELTPVSFEEWKKIQPEMDEIGGKIKEW